MTPTETRVLKIIWDNKGKASLLKIAQELKISTDYSHLICRGLLKNKVIELFQREYRVTDLGKAKLEELQLIERAPRAKKVVRPKKVPQKLTAPKRAGKKERRKATPTSVRPAPRPRAQEKPRPMGSSLVGEQTITQLSSLTPKLIEILKVKGFRTLEDVATSGVVKLMQTIEGLELKQAANMINEARKKLRKEGRKYLWEGPEL